MTVGPTNGATGVNPTAPISAAVTSGKLTAITLTNAIGRQVNGVLSTDNDTVGVGAPISLQFVGKVANKAAIQRRLKVTTTPATLGSWGWLPDTSTGSVVHWRPQSYWKPGTQVSVSARLYGLPYDETGSYGRADITLRFHVGRSQISYGNVQTKRLVVKRNGQTLWNWPTSFGLESDINRITPVGTYVTMDKYKTTNFNNPRFGYTNVPIKWATRISNNGIFIHAYPKTTAQQGVSNVTHGCLNLTDKRGKQFYDSSLFGDPVEIVDPGENAPTLGPDDGDISDWTIPWNQWQRMSALK